MAAPLTGRPKLNYSDLLLELSADDIADEIKETVAELGGSPDTWRERAIPAVLTAGISRVLSRIYSLISYFAEGVEFTESSPADTAEVWATSQYAEERQPATRTVLKILVSCGVGAGPADLSTAFRVGTGEGVDFVLQAAIQIPDGGAEYCYFEAVQAGTESNVDPASVSLIKTPVAGVTISEQELVTAGQEEESIAALYARCTAKWSGIGAASSTFVQNLAMQLDPLLTKVVTRVVSQYFGQMKIYAGQVDGPATSEQLQALEEKIAELAVLQSVDITYEPATVQEVPISGTVHCQAGEVEQAAADVTAAVSEWQAVLGYGDVIRVSDVWRKLFTSDSIDNVDLQFTSEVEVDMWKLTVLINDLVFE